MNKKLKNKTTIIFDFDGTLGNSFNFFVNFYHNEILKLGHNITKEEIRKLIRNKHLSEIMKEYNISKLKAIYLFFRFKKDFKKVNEKIKLFPEIKKLLLELEKKYDLVLLTSNDKKHIKNILKKNKILHCFKELYFKSSFNHKSRFIKKIIKKHNLKKEEVIYIGDELRDFESCQEIAVDCINVSYGFNSKKLLESENKFVVDNVKELKQLFL